MKHFSQYQLVAFLEEKMESIWPQKLSHRVELKFDPGFQVIGEYFSQIDSQYRINLTQILTNYSESGSNFSSTRDSTFQVKICPFFLSVMLFSYHHW